VIDRRTTAEVVAHIAEFDERALYERFHFASMYSYCVGRLRDSEDSAYKRIQAARVCREFPRLFEDLAAGRLNLSAVCLLAPHLRVENADEIVEWATGKTNAAIRQWLAERFAPPAGAPTPPARQIEAPLVQLAVRQVAFPSKEVAPATQPAASTIETVAVAGVAAADPEAPPQYHMQFTMTCEDLERFRHAQALLSHAIPSGDAAAIYRRAIEAIIREHERRKHAKTLKPTGDATKPEDAKRNGAAPSRHIPAPVRRAVFVRDAGRCTAVSKAGERCRERRFLEYDHIIPVARGGPSTAENVRLRCRAHNQEAATELFGKPFMKERRRAAAAAAEERRVRTPWKEAVPVLRGP
jgi:5-methylcytosine-specific restriction endonuclease McrA